MISVFDNNINDKDMYIESAKYSLFQEGSVRQKIRVCYQCTWTDIFKQRTLLMDDAT